MSDEVGGTAPGYYFVIIGPAGALIARVVVFSGNMGWIPTESHPDSWIDRYQIFLCGGIVMLLRSCFQCKFHGMKGVNSRKTSRCARENFYFRFSKYTANKALNRYLKQESLDRDLPFSAAAHGYSLE